jgi:group II intron reverse transcriptase/maturase
MNDPGKSDESVVSKKPANDALPLWAWAEEQAEKRDSAKRNPDQVGTPRTQGRKQGVSLGLMGVREKAKQERKTRFTALFHHLNLPRLQQAFERLQPKAAPGADGEVWQTYRTQQDERLKGLLARLRAGTYRAKPSRRVFIPKPDGRQRPLGIAALEDKIVQGAVVEVLNAIYEADFLGFSYGFRPGRSPHRALDAWATALRERKVRWVLDLDIRSYFDKVSHEWLLRFLQHRIADPRMLRLIQKWLKAGVLENGQWKPTEEGTPQGATISPLLANVYLHYVFDLWVQHWRKHHATGELSVVRFADDAVIGFETEKDARCFLEQLRARMQKFNLELHPEKTRLVRFGRFAGTDCALVGRKPETFTFLGFTHICGRSRSGKYLLRRHTIAKRQRAKLQEVKRELMARRHDPIPQQGGWLRQVVRGYYNYYGVPTNSRSIEQFREEVTKAWLRALRRRSQRHNLPWERMKILSDRWLPRARLCHPWPWDRFHANTQGKSRVR